MNITPFLVCVAISCQASYWSWIFSSRYISKLLDHLSVVNSSGGVAPRISLERKIFSLFLTKPDAVIQNYNMQVWQVFDQVA
jgi:hypothetical protein